MRYETYKFVVSCKCSHAITAQTCTQDRHISCKQLRQNTHLRRICVCSLIRSRREFASFWSRELSGVDKPLLIQTQHILDMQTHTIYVCRELLGVNKHTQTCKHISHIYRHTSSTPHNFLFQQLYGFCSSFVPLCLRLGICL
jgi:hypothetical protein